MNAIYIQTDVPHYIVKAYFEKAASTSVFRGYKYFFDLREFCLEGEQLRIRLAITRGQRGAPGVRSIFALKDCRRQE